MCVGGVNGSPQAPNIGRLVGFARWAVGGVRWVVGGRWAVGGEWWVGRWWVVGGERWAVRGESWVIGEIVKLIDEKIKTFTITDDDESYYSFSVLREIRAIIGRDRGGDVGRRPEDEDIIDSDSQFIPVIPYDAVMNIPIYIQP